MLRRFGALNAAMFSTKPVSTTGLAGIMNTARSVIVPSYLVQFRRRRTRSTTDTNDRGSPSSFDIENAGLWAELSVVLSICMLRRLSG